MLRINYVVDADSLSTNRILSRGLQSDQMYIPGERNALTLYATKE